jgi:hypothetical protein
MLYLVFIFQGEIELCLFMWYYSSIWTKLPFLSMLMESLLEKRLFSSESGSFIGFLKFFVEFTKFAAAFVSVFG